MKNTVLLAKNLLDPEGVIVASGERLAREVVPLLQDGQSVTIDTLGLGGPSSSYFNIFLKMIVDEVGADALDRVHFTFRSSILRSLYERSLAAVRQQSAS